MYMKCCCGASIEYNDLNLTFIIQRFLENHKNCPKIDKKDEFNISLAQQYTEIKLENDLLNRHKDKLEKKVSELAEIISLNINHIYAKGSYMKNDKDETKYVIIYGSMFDGFQGVIGPFNSEDEAETYMEAHNLGHFEKDVRLLEKV